MNILVEYWHPERPQRWSRTDTVDLPLDASTPLPEGLGLPYLRPLHGPDGWVLRFRQAGDRIHALLCTPDPVGAGRWEDATLPASRAPWGALAWRNSLQTWLEAHVGHGFELFQHRVWGRSTVWRVEGRRTWWFKESYGLPPGEGAAMRLAIADSGPLAIPHLVAAEGPRALMETFSGTSLSKADPEAWAVGVRAVLDFCATADVERWAAAGVRDLRQGHWHSRLQELFAAYDEDPAHADTYAGRFDGLPFAVTPHDLGPCNLRWLGDGHVQAFDWSDVVISHPGMVVDRFFNEPHSDAHREAVMAAFGDPEQWAATRRIALLHEVWRYHQELAWLDDDAPLSLRLRAQNQRQLQRMLGVG